PRYGSRVRRTNGVTSTPSTGRSAKITVDTATRITPAPHRLRISSSHCDPKSVATSLAVRGGATRTAGSARGRVDRAAEAAVPSPVDLDPPPQVVARENGPGRVEEHHLGVRALPEQEGARALLPRATDEQIHVGQVRNVEVPLQRALRDPRRRQS